MAKATFTPKEIQVLVAAFTNFCEYCEFEATWDKIGSVYYKAKQATVGYNLYKKKPTDDDIKFIMNDEKYVDFITYKQVNFLIRQQR